MKFFDLLRMSISNLWKRKLRTVLTVLGVIIGITSIVVMIALGNGLKQSMLDNYSNYSSMTQIQIYSGGYYYSSSSSQDEEKRLDDAFIQQLLSMEHVEAVYPKLNISAIAKVGQYRGYLDIYGITQEELATMDIPIAQGKLPDSDTELQFFYGNNVLMNFYVDKTNASPWWDNNEMPNIDVMNDPIFVIFDEDAYWSLQNGGDGTTPVKQPKKYIIEACGLMGGEFGEWGNRYGQSILCDIDALKAELKRIFKKNPIPGQPTRKNGKPYNELFYSEMVVQVDDMANVAELTTMINDMGYNASSSEIGRAHV